MFSSTLILQLSHVICYFMSSCLHTPHTTSLHHSNHRFDSEVVSQALAAGNINPDEGVDGSFELLSTTNERAHTGQWVGECACWCIVLWVWRIFLLCWLVWNKCFFYTDLCCGK